MLSVFRTGVILQVIWDLLLVSFSVVEQMYLIRAGREQIPPVVEMSRKVEVKRGATEQQMTTCQAGNTTLGVTLTLKNATEQRI
jgi:hypothetical protein